MDEPSRRSGVLAVPGPLLTTIPPWLAALPGDACLGTKDLAELFGVAEQTIHQWLHKNWLPGPTFCDSRFKWGCRFSWRARTIRNFIRHQAGVKNSTAPPIPGSPIPGESPKLQYHNPRKDP